MGNVPDFKSGEFSKSIRPDFEMISLSCEIATR